MKPYEKVCQLADEYAKNNMQKYFYIITGLPLWYIGYALGYIRGIILAVKQSIQAK